MSVVWTSLTILGLIFLVALLAVMLWSGAWRRYPFLLLYLFAALTAEALDLLLYARIGNVHSPVYFNTYYTGDMVLHGLILTMVLFLIREALVGNHSPDLSAFAIFACGIAFVAATLYMLYTGAGSFFPLSRNLSFVEEVLNFVLWTILIRNRSRDVVLLLVSAGLGIQVTGEVIGRSVRMYVVSPSVSWLPDALVMICQLFALYVWYRAFAAYRRQHAVPRQQTSLAS